jgi:hypothetical protein
MGDLGIQFQRNLGEENTTFVFTLEELKACRTASLCC